jgi:hypothetical protein
MVVALLALFIAMGGVGYAALKLPRNSVGSKQLKANAVKSAKVKDTSLLRDDVAAGQLRAGPAGPGGQRGLNGDKGPRGKTGAPGTEMLTFDGQFEEDAVYHPITTINGLRLSIYCSNFDNPGLGLAVERIDTAHGFHGWGTTWNGATIQRAAIVLNGPQSDGMEILGSGSAEIDVVVKAPGTGVTPGYTRIDLKGINGPGVCNYRAVVIPPS